MKEVGIGRQHNRNMTGCRLISDGVLRTTPQAMPLFAVLMILIDMARVSIHARQTLDPQSSQANCFRGVQHKAAGSSNPGLED